MNDETISVTGIECPYCSAPVGEWCRDPRTKEVRGGSLLTHSERMRLVVAHNRAVTGIDHNN